VFVLMQTTNSAQPTKSHNLYPQYWPFNLY